MKRLPRMCYLRTRCCMLVLIPLAVIAPILIILNGFKDATKDPAEVRRTVVEPEPENPNYWNADGSRVREQKVMGLRNVDNSTTEPQIVDFRAVYQGSTYPNIVESRKTEYGNNDHKVIEQRNTNSGNNGQNETGPWNNKDHGNNDQNNIETIKTQPGTSNHVPPVHIDSGTVKTQPGKGNHVPPVHIDSGTVPPPPDRHNWTNLEPSEPTVLELFMAEFAIQQGVIPPRNPRKIRNDWQLVNATHDIYLYSAYLDDRPALHRPHIRLIGVADPRANDTALYCLHWYSTKNTPEVTAIVMKAVGPEIGLRDGRTFGQYIFSCRVPKNPSGDTWATEDTQVNSSTKNTWEQENNRTTENTRVGGSTRVPGSIRTLEHTRVLGRTWSPKSTWILQNARVPKITRTLKNYRIQQNSRVPSNSQTSDGGRVPGVNEIPKNSRASEDTRAYVDLTKVSRINPRVSTGARVPRKVSVVSAYDIHPSNVLEVQIPVNPVKVIEFGHCMSIVYWQRDPLRIVEWLELHRIWGVGEVNVYGHGLDNVTLEVLRRYERTGFVRFREVSTVVEEDGEWPILLNMSPVLNDCLYRNLYRFRYTVCTDFDEAIVPRGSSRNYAEMLKAATIRVPETYGSAFPIKSLAFRNVYFFLDFGPVLPDPWYLTTVRYQTRISPSRYGYSFKSITRTVDCLGLQNHYCWEPLDGDKSHPGWNIDVEVEIGLNQHYKKCHFDQYLQQDGLCLRMMATSFRDRTMERFREELELKVQEVLVELDLVDTRPVETAAISLI